MKNLKSLMAISFAVLSLGSFAADKVYEAKDSGNIIDFFKFMTMTIKEKTISKDINLDSEVFFNSINERFEKIAKDKE